MFFESPMNRPGLHSNKPRVLCHGDLRPVKIDVPAYAPVRALCRCVCPAAISGFVTSGIINSIKRKARWAWPHVSVESRKVISPTRPHFQSPRAIVLILWMRRTMASVFRLLPNIIGLAVITAVFCVNVLSQAPTASRAPVDQCGRIYKFLQSAIASAQAFSRANKTLQNGPTLKPTTRKIRILCYHETYLTVKPANIATFRRKILTVEQFAQAVEAGA